jgi:hypothetical protein
MTGKIAFVIGCLVLLPAVSACGFAYNGMSASPDLVAMADSAPVTINGTAVSVPGTIEGLGEPIQSPADGARVEGSAPPHVTFLKAGPVDGTIAGSFTVAVSTDPTAHKALTNLRTPTDQARAASAVGQAGRTTSVLRSGPYTVLKIANTETISGAGLGYPDRVYNDYLFAGSGDGSVISVTTDVLPEKEVVAYIAAITS